MKDGDVAGLAVFQDPYAYLAVKQTDGLKYIAMINSGTVIDSIPMKGSTIYFKTSVSNASKKGFQYSMDNKVFTPIGNEIIMRFSLKIFTGNKFCLQLCNKRYWWLC